MATELGGGAEVVARLLNSLAWLRSETGTFWSWLEMRAPVKRSGEGIVMMTKLDDGSIGLGTVELKADALVLTTNSRERAERGRVLLEAALGDLVDPPAIESRDLADESDSAADGNELPPQPQSPLTPDQQRAFIHAHLDKYYANLLDQPVPDLGDISRRRASRTSKGRERLVTWLKRLENMNARKPADSPMATYDAGWLWRALGVSDLRK